ncbi:MAG: hypothetical protein Tsb0020_26130 [Haliangiales bacterium]
MNRPLLTLSILTALFGGVATGCMGEGGSGDTQGGLAGQDGVDEPGERLSVDGTMFLAPGEPDPRLDPSQQSIVDITTEDNPCDGPTDILVFGDDPFGRTALVPVLAEMGHRVTEADRLPEDLSGFHVIMHVGFDLPLRADEQQRLVTFVEDGGAVHLTGERPCCESMNASLTAIVRATVTDSDDIVLGRQGDVLDITGFQRFLYAFNPDANGGLTQVPNQVDILRLASPGGIAGLAPGNVIATGFEGQPVAAAWDAPDLKERSGRLSVVMDTNWLTVLQLEDNLGYLENLLGFMCEAGPLDEDGDGVPAKTDCDDGDPNVGGLLFEDDFSQDTGFFQTTAQLDAPWLYEDGFTVATEGGQQVQLGAQREWENAVVIAKLSGRGTEAGCGNDPGQEPCSSSERWRAGVVLRGALDADQDEGFHGYRCALASNAENGCFEDGLFLQLAEFMDAPEDDISSECDQPADCPPNTTFDQLDRENHDLIDLGVGDTGVIKFYAVGADMYCEASSADGQTVAVRGSSPSFVSGTVGLSTLNIYGEYDYVRVCEALALPGEALSSF